MKTKKIFKKLVLIVTLCFFMILWSERDILIVSAGWGNRLLELLYTICATVIFAVTIMYIFCIDETDFSANEIKKGYAVIGLSQIIAGLPMYTQRFLYGDDLWGFQTSFNGSLDSGLYFSRPFIGFLLGFLRDTSFISIKEFRIFNGIILFLLGCILYRFILSQTGKKLFSIALPIVITSSCIAVDCIAYASIYPIFASLLFSAVSFVVYFEGKKRDGISKVFSTIISVVCLFSAFCMYQIGTTIVFVMYMIYEKNSGTKGKKSFFDAFIYLIYYGISAIIYLLLTQFFQFATGVSAGQGARGEIHLSIQHLLGKAYWFITTVIPQTFCRIVGVIFGNRLFNEHNMFYSCTYRSNSVEKLVAILLGVLIISSIVVNTYRKKSIVYLLIAVIAVPLSFWPFLVLPESTYLTYYSLGIILLLIWYVFDGLALFFEYLKKRCSHFGKEQVRKNAINVISGILLAIIVLQSNYYAENTWVNYSRDSYEYIANSIVGQLQSKDTKTIFVRGNIGPYVGGREYVIFCVKDILLEMNYDPNEYKIMQCDSEYYISIFNDNEVSEMREVLGDVKMEQLLTYYMHDDLYSRWMYNGMANDNEALSFLQECFLMTEQMVKSDNNDVVFIDMSGFMTRNTF